MADKTLGQKIREFRIQTGKSQYELELSMNSSPGTISRIEKDKTNPTKETLLLIAKALELDEYQTSSLFQIIPSVTAKTLAVINEFSKQEKLEEVLQTAVNEINFKLGYISSAVLLLKGQTLWAKRFGADPVSTKAMEIVGLTFGDLKVSNDIDANNILLRAALEGQLYESSNFYDFARGAIGKTACRIL